MEKIRAFDIAEGRVELRREGKVWVTLDDSSLVFTNISDYQDWVDDLQEVANEIREGK